MQRPMDHVDDIVLRAIIVTNNAYHVPTDHSLLKSRRRGSGYSRYVRFGNVDGNTILLLHALCIDWICHLFLESWSNLRTPIRQYDRGHCFEFS